MEIIGGIALALLTLFVLLASLVYLTDGLRTLRNEANPSVRAVVWLVIAVFFAFTTLGLAHETLEQFGVVDPPSTCTVTEYQDAEGNATSTASTCYD